jgi:hypothetical protein
MSRTTTLRDRRPHAAGNDGRSEVHDCTANANLPLAASSAGRA